MKTRWTRFLWAPLFLVVAGFSYLAIRAHLNIVTLNVQDAELSKVMRKIKWQTWETILVNREVQGRITLKVHNAPLEEVLDIISKQTRSRWSLYYPLYRTSQSLDAFKSTVRGQRSPEQSGWTNLLLHPDKPGIMGASSKASVRQPVTLNFTNLDMRIALIALMRFADVSIVPADGLDRQVSLQLERASFKKAMRKLAKGLRCDWNYYYALESPKPPPEFAQDQQDFPDDFPPPPPGGGPPPGFGDGGPPPPGGPMLPKPLTPQEEKQREADFKTLMGILPADQRAQLEKERKMHEAVQSASPEQRQSVLQKVISSSSDTTEERKKGLLSTTPEQRVAIDRQKNQLGGGKTQKQTQ